MITSIDGRRKSSGASAIEFSDTTAADEVFGRDNAVAIASAGQQPASIGVPGDRSRYYSGPPTSVSIELLDVGGAPAPNVKNWV